MLPINESMSYTASVEDVAALYADPEYGKSRAESFGSAQAKVTITGDAASSFTVRTTVIAPKALIPAKYRSLVGDSVEVTETQRWNAPSGADDRTGTMTIEVKGAPMSFDGTFTVKPTSSGCRLDVSASLSVKIPLMGSAIEKAAAPQIGKVLKHEESHANCALAARK